MPSTTALYSAKVKPSTMIEAYYDNKHERDGLTFRAAITALLALFGLIVCIIATVTSDTLHPVIAVLVVASIALYGAFVVFQNRLEKRQKMHDYLSGWLTARGFKNFTA